MRRCGANEPRLSPLASPPQLDGCATRSDDFVLVIGATNRPGEIDEAARRRFVKRIYVPLPDAASRDQLFRVRRAHTLPLLSPLPATRCPPLRLRLLLLLLLLPLLQRLVRGHPNSLQDADFACLVAATDGYSGADVDQVRRRRGLRRQRGEVATLFHRSCCCSCCCPARWRRRRRSAPCATPSQPRPTSSPWTRPPSRRSRGRTLRRRCGPRGRLCRLGRSAHVRRAGGGLCSLLVEAESLRPAIPLTPPLSPDETWHAQFGTQASPDSLDKLDGYMASAQAMRERRGAGGGGTVAAAAGGAGQQAYL